MHCCRVCGLCNVLLHVCIEHPDITIAMMSDAWGATFMLKGAIAIIATWTSCFCPAAMKHRFSRELNST
eukprot:3202573-Amphidinium_carterae.1